MGTEESTKETERKKEREGRKVHLPTLTPPCAKNEGKEHSLRERCDLNALTSCCFSSAIEWKVRRVREGERDLNSNAFLRFKVRQQGYPNTKLGAKNRFM